MYFHSYPLLFLSSPLFPNLFWFYTTTSPTSFSSCALISRLLPSAFRAVSLWLPRYSFCQSNWYCSKSSYVPNTGTYCSASWSWFPRIYHFFDIEKVSKLSPGAPNVLDPEPDIKSALENAVPRCHFFLTSSSSCSTKESFIQKWICRHMR